MSSQSVDSAQMLADIDEPPAPTAQAEVVVKGRNVEVPDHFRIYVSENLARLERFDRTIYMFDVELDQHLVQILAWERIVYEPATIDA